MRIVPERNASTRYLPYIYTLLGLAAWWAVKRGLLWPAATYRCPLLVHTGVACPTCGGVRAALAFGSGDLVLAFQQNPLVALALTVLAVWLLAALVMTAVPRWRRTLTVSPAEGRMLRVAALLLLAGSWIYEIVRHWR